MTAATIHAITRTEPTLADSHTTTNGNHVSSGTPSRRLRALPDPPPTESTDEELLVRSARGDQEAFAELYDRVAGKVYGVVRRVLRDPSQSEEVAQEVLVEVWRKAARYDQEQAKATTWILTIAHRRAVDRVRREQSVRDRHDRAAIANHERSSDVVADAVTTRFEHEAVRNALDELTDLQREAVELAYFGGNTYRQVSELLDIPLGTAKTRLRDGLIRLRDAMEVMS